MLNFFLRGSSAKSERRAAIVLRATTADPPLDDTPKRNVNPRKAFGCKNRSAKLQFFHIHDPGRHPAGTLPHSCSLFPISR